MQTKVSQSIIFLLGLIIYLPTFAYYCSTAQNHGYINLGDSFQKVQEACGTPNVIAPQPKDNVQINNIEDWTYSNRFLLEKMRYTLPGPYRQNSYYPHSNTGPLPPVQAVYPPDVTFKVVNGIIEGINVDGKDLSYSSLCGTGMQVRVGASAAALVRACGRPNYVYDTEQSETTIKPDIVTWRYDNGSEQKPLSLKFTNGVLSNILD